MDTLAPLVLLSPLLGFLVNALFGRQLPRRVVGWVGAGSVGLAFLFALLILAQVLGGQKLDQTYFTWWQSADFNVPFNLYVDALSTLMILVITGVGFLIHVYSIGYMREDAGFSRFFAYMNLFVFSMLLLVLSGNLVWLIIGWAMVGLSSYLLIGFWFERRSAVLAARKAFVMNTIGDVGMVFAAFLIFLNLRVLDFQGLFSRVHQLPRGGIVITGICLLLLVGAVAKSAQLPLHTWLPDAMEGPTPVSALIHAATMVTAGVYLVARMHLLYDWAPAAAATVAVIGGVTALFAATIGTAQIDIKRILAYSTMSQIGYMFLAVGIGAYTAGMFHFMTHAFFKALLVLAAGAVVAGYIPVASFLSPVFGQPVEVGTLAFWGLAGLTLAASAVGFALAYLLYARRPQLAVAWRTRLGPVHALVEHKYYIDELYDRLFVRPGLALARFFNDIVEPRVIDGAVNAVAAGVMLEAREFRGIQTGRVRSYALVTLGGAVGVLGIVAYFLGYLPWKPAA